MNLKSAIRRIVGDGIYTAAHNIKASLKPAPKPAEVPEEQIERSGKQSETFWATREKDNPAWAQAYWDGRTLPPRKVIAEAIGALDAATVLEVGVHAGANLWAIDQIRVYDLLAGVELSDHVLAAAQSFLGNSLRSPHDLRLGNGKELPFADRSFDVVLSSIMLSCVGPEYVRNVLAEMVRVSKRYIVLAEPYDVSEQGATVEGIPDPYPNTTYWVRNYPGLLSKMGHPTRLISIQHIDEKDRIGHLNSVQVLEILR